MIVHLHTCNGVSHFRTFKCANLCNVHADEIIVIKICKFWQVPFIAQNVNYCIFAYN